MNENGIPESNRTDEQTFLPSLQIIDSINSDREATCNANTCWNKKLWCVFFGMGTWLPVNMVIAQIPYLTQSAPEAWSLPSYFVVTIQLANVIPMLYYCNKRALAHHNAMLILFFLILSTISMVALAFTYHIIVNICNQPHSLYFYIFLFLVACECCVSSLLFLPFMSRLPGDCLMPFFIGEGLNTLVPGMLSLIQGMTQKGSCTHPNTMAFSTRAFFLCGAFLMCVSTISFLHLGRLAQCTPVTNNKLKELTTSRTLTTDDEVGWRSYRLLLLTLQAIFSFTHYGITSGLQSYSCLPYGEVIYHLSVNINQVLESITAYLLSLSNLLATRRLLAICAVQVSLVSYQTATAFMSPTPPFVRTHFGSVHIILVWSIANMMSSYIKLSIAAIFRIKKPDNLVYYGAVTQAGAVVGATCSFLLINYTELLSNVSPPPCKP